MRVPFTHNNNVRTRIWDHSYPSMPSYWTSSDSSSWLYTRTSYLVVACGYHHKIEIEILNSCSSTWFRAEPVPVGGHCTSSPPEHDHFWCPVYCEIIIIRTRLTRADIRRCGIAMNFIASLSHTLPSQIVDAL